jgi:hypothetical protein
MKEIEFKEMDMPVCINMTNDLTETVKFLVLGTDSQEVATTMALEARSQGKGGFQADVVDDSQSYRDSAYLADCDDDLEAISRTASKSLLFHDLCQSASLATHALDDSGSPDKIRVIVRESSFDGTSDVLVFLDEKGVMQPYLVDQNAIALNQKGYGVRLLKVTDVESLKTAGNDSVLKTLLFYKEQTINQPIYPGFCVLNAPQF